LSKGTPIRTLAAIWATKLSAWLLRLLGREGTHVPGRVALRIDPLFVSHIAKPPRVVAVTGTNGKTSVTNMLSDVLIEQGVRVTTNRIGSNLIEGISVALASAVTIWGKSRADIAVLELDERSGRLVLPGLDPDVLICTNLTRDSIKRNAHPWYIKWVLESELSERALLVLNADDQIASRLGSENNPKVFFSVDPQPDEHETPHGVALDAMACSYCNRLLEWDCWRFNHIGRARCPNCDYRSPEAEYRVTAIDRAKARLSLSLRGEALEGALANDNIVNVYNEIAVIAALDVLRVPRDAIISSLNHLAPPVTRFDQERIGDTLLVRQLAKGLVGTACSRAFAYLSSFSGRKAIVMTIDGEHEDPHEVENTAWIYDADYEYLADENISQIVIGGNHRYDHALRLAIAGVEPSRIVTVASEIETAQLVQVEDVDVIGNMYAPHNAVRTGSRVQRRIRERLRELMRSRRGSQQ